MYKQYKITRRVESFLEYITIGELEIQHDKYHHDVSIMNGDFLDKVAVELLIDELRRLHKNM